MRARILFTFGSIGGGIVLLGLLGQSLWAAPVLTLPQQSRPAAPCFDDANRYMNCNNGTVTDMVTGLIWLANANCFSSQTYATANSMAATLATGQCDLIDGSFAGDWRLPTEAEWEATVAEAVSMVCMGANRPPLTDTAGTGCFIDEVSHVFSNVLLSPYWSSTTDTASPTFARVVGFVNGNIFSAIKSGSPANVWPVRGGR